MLVAQDRHPQAECFVSRPVQRWRGTETMPILVRDILGGLSDACGFLKGKPAREWTEPRTENPHGKTKATRRWPKSLNLLVGCEWLEHSTYGLRVRCSTN